MDSTHHRPKMRRWAPLPYTTITYAPNFTFTLTSPLAMAPKGSEGTEGHALLLTNKKRLLPCTDDKSSLSLYKCYLTMSTLIIWIIWSYLSVEVLKFKQTFFWPGYIFIMHQLLSIKYSFRLTLTLSEVQEFLFGLVRYLKSLLISRAKPRSLWLFMFTNDPQNESTAFIW